MGITIFYYNSLKLLANTNISLLGIIFRSSSSSYHVTRFYQLVARFVCWRIADAHHKACRQRLE